MEKAQLPPFKEVQETGPGRLNLNVKFVLSRTLMILLGLLFSLILVEVSLNILPVPNRFKLMEELTQLWESDEELLLHLKPNLNQRVSSHPEFNFSVKTNGSGLRDEEFAGDYDIAAIGDSFTFGFGVNEDESWPSRLEAMSGARVANLGWAGWNSYVYPTTIKRYAVPLQARIWIWTFFSNDLPESSGAEKFLTSGRKDYLEWAAEGNLIASELSFPYNLRTVQLMAALYNPELFLLPDSGERIFDNGQFRMRLSSYAWEKTDFSDPEVREGWDLTKAALEEAKNLAISRDAYLVVVNIPNREHVYWPYIRAEMQGFDVQQLDEVASLLEEFCQSRGIAYLNLLSGFQQQAQAGKMLYFPADGHWNQAGHELAAEQIYEKLLQDGLLNR